MITAFSPPLQYDLQTALERADKGDQKEEQSTNKNVLPRSDSKKSIGKAEIIIRTPSREGGYYFELLKHLLFSIVI